MRKVQAQGHNMTYQSPDVLGTARSAGTAQELSGLIGMTFVPRRSVILEEEITAPMKLQQECLWELYVQEWELNLAAVPGRGVSLLDFIPAISCVVLYPFV